MSEDFEPVVVRVFACTDGTYRFCDARRAKVDTSGVAYESKPEATRAAIEAARDEGHEIEYLIGGGVSRSVAERCKIKVHRSVRHG
jgi:hypothetical protein